MNLHDIRSPMAHIEIIRDYCTMYYGFTFRIMDNQRQVEYQAHLQGNWASLTERDTLSYTNAALAWHDNGRGRVRE